MQNTTWIVVADASKAKIYSAHKASLFNGNGQKLALVSEHEHPESRKLDTALASDKQGKFGLATFVEASDPHKYEEERFAMELAKKLIKDRSENLFHDLIFIAPATFIGMLNKHLPDPLTKLVNLTIEKNYTRFDENELVLRLQEYL